MRCSGMFKFLLLGAASLTLLTNCRSTDSGSALRDLDSSAASTSDLVGQTFIGSTESTSGDGKALLLSQKMSFVNESVVELVSTDKDGKESTVVYSYKSGESKVTMSLKKDSELKSLKTLTIADDGKTLKDGETKYQLVSKEEQAIIEFNERSSSAPVNECRGNSRVIANMAWGEHPESHCRRIALRDGLRYCGWKTNPDYFADRSRWPYLCLGADRNAPGDSPSQWEFLGPVDGNGRRGQEICRMKADNQGMDETKIIFQRDAYVYEGRFVHFSCYGRKSGNGGGSTPGSSQYKLGITLENVIFRGEEWVEIVKVDSRDRAHQAGLRRGDLISRVNGEIVRSTREFGKMVEKAQRDNTGVLLIEWLDRSENRTRKTRFTFDNRDVRPFPGPGAPGDNGIIRPGPDVLPDDDDKEEVDFDV